MPEKPTYEELEQRIQELEASESKSNSILEALQQKEYLYNNLFKNMLHEVHVWKLVFDDSDKIKTWKLVDANPVALKSWKRSLSEVVGKTPDEIFPGSGATKQFMPVVEQIFSEGRPHIWESHFPDSSQFLHMVSIPLGKYFISTGLDITERRQVEEALRQKHEMLKRTESIAHVGSWEWEIKTDTVTWSDELYRIFQLDPHDEAPRWDEHSKLLHPEDFEKLSHSAEKAIVDGESYEIELRAIRKDGDTRICISKGFPEIGKDGNVVRLFGLFQDITDQKHAEEKLRGSEEKYRKLYEDAAIGIFHSSFEGQFLDVNPALANMLGYETPQEVLDSIYSIAEQIYVKPQVRDEVVVQLLAKGETVKVENLYRRKDGSVWNAYLYLRYVSDSTGRPTCLEGFVEDITDRKQAEEALKESKTFLESMTDIAYTTDDKGNLIWVNPAAERLTGIPQEDIIGKSFLPLFVESDHASLMDVYKRTLAGESLENTLTFKSDVTCHFTSLPKRDQKGDIIGTFGVARNISEQKAAESALQISETRLKKAQAMAKVGNWEYDIATGKVWGSEEAFHIYGIERTSEFLPLDGVESYIIDAKRVNQALVDLLTQNTPYDIEFQIQPKNRKESIHVHSMAELVYDGDGKPEKVVGVIQDITEPKKAEEILSQKHEMLQNTEAMAHIGSWEWDIQRDRAYWSEELFRIFGRNPAGGAPPFAEQSELYGNGDMQRLKNAVENCIKRGTSYEIELHAIRTDGEIRHCISRGKPQYNENGEVSRIIGSFQDITERKQAEEERKKLQDQLSQAQKLESIGRLAGGVAHDFNNMLGVILGHLEFALEKIEEDNGLHYDLKEIQKAAQRSADLTKQLLTFARKQVISPKPLDLNDTVESMLNMLRRLIGEDIDLVWKPSAHLWSVKMDPSQIDQILANLCVNARDAIDGVGKLTIETGEKSFDEEYCKEHAGFIPGDFVLLAVCDNGCGMDKDTLENLFEPFFTTKEVGKGTGLGLATVYGIVKQNNGFINVYSEPGRGSTFNIYLPRFVGEEDVDKNVSEKKATVGGTETILVVEDEPSILRMTRMMLERKGYSVLSAATPTEAVDKAKEHSGSVDLLMTDVVMPEMNGRDLAEKITDLYPDIRLLFMSGYTEAIIANQGVLDDGVAFIQKPFSMADMTEKVREVLSEHPSLD